MLPRILLLPLCTSPKRRARATERSVQPRLPRPTVQLLILHNHRLPRLNSLQTRGTHRP